MDFRRRNFATDFAPGIMLGTYARRAFRDEFWNEYSSHVMAWSYIISWQLSTFMHGENTDKKPCYRFGRLPPPLLLYVLYGACIFVDSCISHHIIFLVKSVEKEYQVQTVCQEGYVTTRPPASPVSPFKGWFLPPIFTTDPRRPTFLFFR